MKKVITALEDLIHNRKELIQGFNDKSKPWNIGNETLCTQLTDVFSEFLSNEIQYLEKVIQYVEKGNSKKCKHPKKDHDRCDGVLYCMNCNADL